MRKPTKKFRPPPLEPSATLAAPAGSQQGDESEASSAKQQKQAIGNNPDGNVADTGKDPDRKVPPDNSVLVRGVQGSSIPNWNVLVEENKALECKDPEDKGPKKKGPDCKNPEDKGPDSKDPEDKSPESKDPEEKSPENRVPEIKGPEGEGPESKTPEGERNVSKMRVQKRRSRCGKCIGCLQEYDCGECKACKLAEFVANSIVACMITSPSSYRTFSCST